MPVIALPGAGGGFALADGYHLPPVNFSPSEAAVLLLALRGLGGAAATPFGEAPESAEAKLRVALRPGVLAEAERTLDAIVIQPLRRPPHPAHLLAFHDAVHRERWLRVEYASLRRVANHLLLPIRLSAAEGRWYCVAISHEAGEERSFRLDRVRGVAPIAPPIGADAARSAAARSRPADDDPRHPEVIVRLSAGGVRVAEETPCWAGRTTPVAPDAWELRFRCPPGELAYDARELHALGPSAVVLAPPDLRVLVLERAKATAAAYAESDSVDRAAEG